MMQDTIGEEIWAVLAGQCHVQFEETFLSSKCKGPNKSLPLLPYPKAPPTIYSVLTKEVLYFPVPASPEFVKLSCFTLRWSLPSEHGSIPGSSEWPFFIQVLNYFEKSGVGTRQATLTSWNCFAESQGRKSYSPWSLLCAHVCALQQSCQLSCFCLQQHSLLLRSSVCRLFKQPWDLIDFLSYLGM